MFISKKDLISLVSEAILSKNILMVQYQHTSDGEIVSHKLAPFDIGSTNPNPKIQNANAEKMYAYSYTHLDKNNKPDPKVCAFNINNFIRIDSTDETFDETDLAMKNLQTTRYDYRGCSFAIHPNRDWFN